MGNGCFCKNSNYIKDINLDSSCPMQPIVNTKSEQIIIKDEEENEKKKFNTLINYLKQKRRKKKKNCKTTKNLQKILTL